MRDEKHWPFPPFVFDQDGFPEGMIQIDPQGSYTGVAEVPEENPVQDADDL